MIYTIGYQGKTPKELLMIAEAVDGIIFDIRYKPYSSDIRFNRSKLEQYLGERYRHVKELGNVNYHGTYEEIEIKDLEKGIEMIEQSEKTVILMCGCWNYRTCHRRFIAERLRARGHQVIELRGYKDVGQTRFSFAVL